MMNHQSNGAAIGSLAIQTSEPNGGHEGMYYKRRTVTRAIRPATDFRNIFTSSGGKKERFIVTLAGLMSASKTSEERS